MHENCDSCHTDYEFTRENTKAVLFVEDAECNHLEATCPTCGAVERIYAMPDIFLQAVQQCQLHLTLHPRADEELLARAQTTWESTVTKEDEEQPLPELPVAWRVALYDDLRNWKGAVE